MTYRFMRIIDDSFGMFLCWVLGGALQLKQALLPGARAAQARPVERILIQKYFGMGSILHAIPLIKVLRKNHPKAVIVFVTTRSYKELVVLCGLADEVLTVDFASLPAFLVSSMRLLKSLATRRWDLSVDLEFFAKFPLLVSLVSRAEIRVGLYHRKIRPEGILTHKIYYNFYRHISRIYLAYAAGLGLEPRKEYYLPVLPSFRQELEQQLRSRFQIPEGRPIVIMNVNAGDLFAFRKWPADHFIVLLSLLMKRYPDYSYVLVGSPRERPYVQDILQKSGAPAGIVVNGAGKTSLKELFALVEMASLVITNDSGPLHIASFYEKNLVAFFGPETPVVYGPVNENALVFYNEDRYCSPCMCVYDSKQSLYAETCEQNVCMSSVNPEEVFRSIEQRFLKDGLA